MASNEYHFITHWHIRAQMAEVAAIIEDAEDLARWWPSVYLEVKTLARGDAQGLGKRVSLYTKGWLPYTLRWQFEVTEISDRGFTLAAEGDFVGRGIWTFEQDGEWVKMTYDWKIAADKPLLKNFSFIFKPIFAANHEWAMRQGERSLALEVQRRHARAGDPTIPPPPAGTPNRILPWLGYAIRHPRSLQSP
jgi:hypothetical protein